MQHFLFKLAIFVESKRVGWGERKRDRQTDMNGLLLGLLTSESFVFILQSGSAVLHYTLEVLSDGDCLTRAMLCMCASEGGSPHR